MTEPPPGVDREAIAGVAVRGAAWSVAARWGTRLFTLAVFALLARLLAPEEFGLAALAAALVEVLRQVGQQGVTQALVRDPDLDDRTISTAFWLSLLGGGALVLLVVAAAPLLERAFGAPGLTPVLRVLSLQLLLSAGQAVPDALLARALRFRALATRTLLASSAGAVAALALALAGAGVWALVAQVLAQSATSAAFLWRATTYRPALVLDRARARPLVRFGWTVSGINLMTTLTQQGDNLVVGLVLGQTALGYYAIAFRLLTSLVDLLAGAFSVLSLPVFARLRADRAATVAALVRADKVVLVLALPVFLALAVLSPVVVPLVFGDGWGRSVPLFQVLCLAGALLCIVPFDRSVLLAAGRPGLELAMTTVFAVGTVVSAWLGARYGLLGAAIAVTARMYLTWPLRLLVLRRVVGLPVAAFLRQLLPVVVAGALLYAVAQAVRALLPARDAPGTLAAAAAAGLVAYAGLLLAVDRPFLVRQVATVRGAVPARLRR